MSILNEYARTLRGILFVEMPAVRQTMASKYFKSYGKKKQFIQSSLPVSYKKGVSCDRLKTTLNVICSNLNFATCYLIHGSLARYVKLRVRMRRECRERFPRHRR